MPRLVDIPGTHCEVFNPKLTTFWGEPDETWNDHMEADRLLPFDETVKRIGKRFATLDQAITVRAHSFGCRGTICAIIENPEILAKIHEIKLICPPISMAELAHYINKNRTKFSVRILEEKMPLMFRGNFLESLHQDTPAINDQFVAILKETGYTGTHVHFDPKDSFLGRNNLNYEEQVMNIVVAATPLISVTKNSYGHNYERYPG